MEKLIVATKNKGKMKEIRSIFNSLPYEIFSMEEAGIKIDVLEDGITFEENALIKATEIQKITGGSVLADDSGLVVDALNGEPGIMSARYGSGIVNGDTGATSYDTGIPKDDTERYLLLLKNMKGVPLEKRTARFVCAAAFVSADTRYVVRGEVEGTILEEPRGENGFGYDPIFLVENIGKTAAELTEEEKNILSHRGRALRSLIEKMKTV